MKFLQLLSLLLLGLNVFAQSDSLSQKKSYKIIGEVIVSGNKKTKTNIILREMFLKKGDTIAIDEVGKKVEQSREFIFNTTLFVDVAVHIAKQDSNKVAVIVLLKERWYIFPLPYFKLVDRNFNDWLVNQHGDLNRVNYGLKFYHNNFSGNNDRLNAWLIFGYNRQIILNYNRPFINKKLTNGFSIGITQSKQKEVNFQTDSSNKQQFLKLQNGDAKTYTKIEAAFTMRPNKHFRHTFRLGYTAEKINDSVAIVNSNYYGNSITSINYLDFFYSLQYFNTNYNAYPTKGFIGSISLYERGWDKTSNLTQITAAALFAKPISKKSFIRNETIATIKFPYNPNFINQNLLGYGSFQMQGLEYYVVDGMAGILDKLTIGTNLFNKNLNLPVKGDTYNKIPFKFYGKIFANVGYVQNPYVNYNRLNNKFLYTYGIGLDIATIYDIVLKIEFSFNQLGGNSLYFER